MRHHVTLLIWWKFGIFCLGDFFDFFPKSKEGLSI